ncbi:hypothetical protein [Virgisporangium ochraceum]|uniref:Uncharacterized protein n=1 Tax=Virgisporangium ochraceum TaxID=65505 RepID=A0A8J3ZRN4_9ACTN|nr:hypothetical protein [Virgisporangium ochraceum]GIJ66275.1 hypothetical protein Voc01_011920 [Virgisporangium ochraceum]
MNNRRGQNGQQGNNFQLGDYVDVASRIAEFRAKHPDGSLQPLNPDQPYRIETIGGDTFVVYAAVAYRTPDDPRPGIGIAQEAYPGKTPYTRGSELQNAETSAWGRAIVATLAADTRRGVASAEEVRNRRAEREEPHGQGQQSEQAVSEQRMGRARKAIAEATDAEGLEKIGRYVSSLVDAGSLTSDEAAELRTALAARFDAIADPNMITRPQSTRLHLLMGQARITDRDEKLKFCTAVVAREITSTNDLTKAEAKQVMDALEQAAAEPVGAEPVGANA